MIFPFYSTFSSEFDVPSLSFIISFIFTLIPYFLSSFLEKTLIFYSIHSLFSFIVLLYYSGLLSFLLFLFLIVPLFLFSIVIFFLLFFSFVALPYCSLSLSLFSIVLSYCCLLFCFLFAGSHKYSCILPWNTSYSFGL